MVRISSGTRKTACFASCCFASCFVSAMVDLLGIDAAIRADPSRYSSRMKGTQDCAEKVNLRGICCKVGGRLRKLRGRSRLGRNPEQGGNKGGLSPHVA